MRELFEFLLNLPGLVMVLIPVLGIVAVITWFGFTVKSAWRVISKSQTQDDEETAALPPFERAKAHLFGTKRDEAVDHLRKAKEKVKTAVVGIILYAATAWLIYGLVLLKHWLLG